MFSIEELNNIIEKLDNGQLKTKVTLIKEQLELQEEFKKKALEIREKLEKLVKD